MALEDKGTVELSIQDLLILRAILTGYLTDSKITLDHINPVDRVNKWNIRDLRSRITTAQSAIERQHIRQQIEVDNATDR